MIEKIEQDPVIRYTLSVAVVLFVLVISAPPFVILFVLFITDFLENPLGQNGVIADAIIRTVIYISTSKLSTLNELAAIIPALVISVFISRRRPGRLTYVGGFAFISFLVAISAGVIVIIFLDADNASHVDQFPYNDRGLHASLEMLRLSLRSMCTYILVMIGFRPPKRIQEHSAQENV